MNFIIHAHAIGYKNNTSQYYKGKIPLRYLLAMKLTLFFIVAFSLCASANAVAQKVNISARNESFKTVMHLVQKQTGYSFVIKEQLLKQSKPITIEVSDKDILEVLPILFIDQPFTYEISGKVINVLPKPLAQTKPDLISHIQQTIRGRVTDSLGTPLQGVAVELKGTNQKTITNNNGVYELLNVPIESVVTFRSLGYQTVEVNADNATLNVVMYLSYSEIKEVDVKFNTGYFQVPKERTTGSYVFIDSAIINRIVSTSFQDRLNGMVSGLSFTDMSFMNISNFDPLTRGSGLVIRGQSSLSSGVSNSPLIVMDNFPFEGELSNINPNDIESITVMKDAAAASIWGARAGNGVVVITTKKGKANTPLKIDVISNLSVVDKPNLSYSNNFLKSPEYIGVEEELFNSGFFDPDLSDIWAYTPVSPVVELLSKLRNGEIDSSFYSNQVSLLSVKDIRNDYKKYFYQKAINQQYAIGLRGGGNRMNYSLSVGMDDNNESLVRNSYSRLTLNSNNSYKLTENIELTAGIINTISTTRRNNQFSFGSGIPIGGQYGSRIYPYASLADEQGKALSVIKDYRPNYVEEMMLLGFKDWTYQPLNELSLSDNSTKINDLILRAGINYKITSYLKTELLYQNQRQKVLLNDYYSPDTYYTRNLVNRFSNVLSNGTINYQLQNRGGILERGQYDWNANNLRIQMAYNSEFSLKHQISAIIGGEVRELKTEGNSNTYYDYMKEVGTSNNALNYTTFLPIQPFGTARIPSPGGSILGVTNRYLSQYSNVGYTYMDLYSITASARRDGANIFGVNTNQKITPLWSAGLGWNLSNETFYTSELVPYVKMRATYGYNGNIYFGTAYVTGVSSTSSVTGLPRITNLTAPNPELRWEKVKNINIGIDFNLKNNIISGTVEYFLKNGQDLIQPMELSPSTGFTSYTGNSASTKTNGIDVTIVSKNLDNAVKWSSTFLLSTLNNSITNYNIPLTRSSISSAVIGVVGKPINSIYSFRWAGLDPANGDPLGYVDETVSNDYSTIVNTFQPENLVYSGSSIPTVFGNLRNDISYMGFDISFSIGYKMGYVFRRASTFLNYSDIIRNGGNAEYNLRWQNPGDEVLTSVPSISLIDNNDRDFFYRHSEALVEKGDHIRFQDFRVGYDLSKIVKGSYFSSLQLFTYMTNLGMLWKANKAGMDPDVFNGYYSHDLPIPFSVSFGLKATL